MKKRILSFLTTSACILGFIFKSYAQPYVGGYIRPERLETGLIGTSLLLKHTDLMVLGFNPKSDGHLQVTDHVATFGTGVTHAASFAGRTGVMSFNGASGAVMNGKQDLLVNNGTFTFAAWIYANSQSTYVPGKFIFKKVEGTKEVSLRIGGNYGQLIFRVIDGSTTYQASANAPVTGILADAWNHVAITFNGANSIGNQVKLYVNGSPKTMTATAAFPTLLPATNSNFMLGENFSGRLDEPLVNNLALGGGEINQFVAGNYPFNTFNLTKTTAFWNFNDAANPGKDLRSYVTTFNQIRSLISGTSIKLHMTISGGSWQTAISTATGRSNFANDINSIVTSQNLAGVDVDLEWPASNTEAAFANYRAFILALRSTLGSGKIISLSLHPGYYKAGIDAINAANHVALQMYGPQPTWWSYPQFVSAANAAISYGIPKSKLIMGLPFFGTTGVAGEQVGYNELIAANPTISFAADQVVYNGKNYTFNGVSTIKEKAAYVCQNGLGGIMAWDLSLHMLDYDHPYSLLKAAITSLNSCSTASFSSMKASLKNGELAVNWATDREENSNYFLVQGSKDNISFYTIDSVKTLAKTSISDKTIFYSAKKTGIESLQHAPIQMGMPLWLGIILFLAGLSVYRKKRKIAIYVLITGIFVLNAVTGCKKHEQMEVSKSPAALYVRVVHVDTQGNKTYSPVVTVLK